MANVISSAIKSGHGNALLYAGALGLLLSDVLPTPADIWYFNLEKNLRDKWQKKEISPTQYWERKTLYYYGPNALWWSLVLGAVVLTGKDFNQKLKVGFGLISLGAVVAVIYKNIRQDIKDQSA